MKKFLFWISVLIVIKLTLHFHVLSMLFDKLFELVHSLWLAHPFYVLICLFFIIGAFQNPENIGKVSESVPKSKEYTCKYESKENNIENIHDNIIYSAVQKGKDIVEIKGKNFCRYIHGELRGFTANTVVVKKANLVIAYDVNLRPLATTHEYSKK